MPHWGIANRYPGIAGLDLILSKKAKEGSESAGNYRSKKMERLIRLDNRVNTQFIRSRTTYTARGRDSCPFRRVRKDRVDRQRIWIMRKRNLIFSDYLVLAVLLAPVSAWAGPEVSINPDSIVLQVGVGSTDSTALVIANSGNSDLDFTVSDDVPPSDYTWTDSNDPAGPTYAWIDISGLGSAVPLGDDGTTAMLNIGFDFPFYDSVYNQFQIGANGVVSLSAGAVGFANAGLPSANTTSQSLAAFWDDLHSGEGGSIRHHATAERLVVSWIGVPLINTSNYETFQVVLYPDGRIIYQYDDLNGTLTSCTVGLQDDKIAGSYIQIAYNETYLEDDLAVEIVPPTDPWLTYPVDSGTVVPGASTSLWFTGSASNLTQGVYTALVTVASNDANNPELYFPVTFTVGRWIETSASDVAVPEGGNTNFQVRLQQYPGQSTTVDVVRVSGDTDITVVGGSTLVFDSGDWDSWKTVTLAAAVDADWTGGSAVIRCSSHSLGYLDVTASEVDTDRDPVALPFFETFENNSSNAGILGVLDGQHGWSADAGAIVQNDVAYSGSQALQLQNATATHLFEDTASVTNVQVTFHARPSADDAEFIPSSDASAMFFVAANLHLVVYSNTVPVELAVVMNTNAWTEFNVACDYASQTWSLSVDGTPVAVHLPFYSAQPKLSEISISGKNLIDDITIVGQEMDIDADGIPDWWELQYYGGPTNANPTATVSNGVNTVRDAYIVGFDPTDPQAGFLISDLSPLPSGNALQWDEVAGRVYTIHWASNLLNGFTVLQTNYTGGVFTDTVHGAFSEGFYRLDVEID